MSLAWIALAVYLLGFLLALVCMLALCRAAKHADQAEGQVLGLDHSTDGQLDRPSPGRGQRHRHAPRDQAPPTRRRPFARGHLRAVR